MTPESQPAVPVVAFERVTKRFGEVVAARDIDLAVAAGEFLSFLGPSGCGKTTTLRMIAGFEQPSEGEVRIDGEVVNGVPAYHRPVNMVFQHYALFPHLTVGDNLAYGLKQRSPRPSRAEIGRRVAESLELVRLEGYEGRRIWEMSGGQQQRVALARALINRPRVLLLDEPLAALDRKLRRDMQIELQNLQRTLGITFVLVTHDQEEALSMSDRICIMRDGRIVQVGAPQELYDRPASRYVADFVGKSNFFSGTLEAASGPYSSVRLDGGVAVAAAPADGFPAGSRVTVSVRPEQITMTRAGEGAPLPGSEAYPARIGNRIFLGEHTEYLLHGGPLGEFLVLAPRRSEAGGRPFDTGDEVLAAWSPETALVLDGD